MVTKGKKTVRAGYKLTDVGVIPEEWEVVPIGDLLVFKNGLNKEKGAFGHGTSIVNYMDVYRNRGLKKCDVGGRVELSSGERKNFQAKKGDVFFTRTSETVDEIGLSSVLLEDISDATFSGFLLRGRPKNDRLDIHYKMWCFSTKSVRQEIVSASSYTTRALTNGGSLSKVRLLLPDNQEQSAIAQVLSDTDALIASLDTLIEKKRAIKQGAMQELLTGKRRLPGFEGGWNEGTLGDYGYCQSGNCFPLSFQGRMGNPIPFFKVSDFSNDGNGIYMSKSNNYVSESDIIAMKATTIPPSAIVYAKIGAGIFLERKRILSKASCIDNNMMAFVVDQTKADVNFAHQLFLTIRFSEFASITALPSLGTRQIMRIEVLVPKKIEQSAIAQVLSDMDAEITAIEAKRDKYDVIKQGMMQELLTGNIRLVGAK